MAIDPSISLQARPPQMQDPMQSVGQMLTLKDMMQRGRLNEMQIKSMEGEQSALAQVRSALQNAGGDIEQALPAIMQISPELGMKFQDLAQKQQAGKTAQTTADLENEKRQREIGLKKVERLGSLAYDLLGMDPVQRVGGYLRALEVIDSDQLLPPQARQKLPPMYDQSVEPILQEAVQAVKTVMQKEEDRRREEDRALNQAKTAEATRHARAMEDAPTEAKLAERAAKGDPVAAEALKRIKTRVPVPGTDVPFPPDVEKQRARLRTAGQPDMSGMGGTATPYTGTAQGQPATRNESVLQGVNQGVANVVRMVVDGRMPLPSGFALRSPYWQNILNIAANYEPGFDATQWRVRLDTRLDFAKGKAATNIRSLNTLIDHLGKLSETITKLDNSRFPTWNKIANWTAQQAGDPRVVAFRTASQAVESEAVALFKGSGATDQEIAQMRQSFDYNGSPEQQMEAAKTVLQLAFGRMGALESQYENAFRKMRDFEFLNSKSKATLKDKLGLDPSQFDPVAALLPQAGGTVKLRAPDGSVQEVPADQVDHYIRLGAKRVQ